MNNLRDRVNLIGNLGADPEVKTFDSGKKMAKVTLATSESYKNGDGEKITDTQWHNLVVWGPMVDVFDKYLRKGSEVAVEGKITYRQYENGDGEKKYFTEIVVNDMLMLDKKKQ
ncbi:MAG: single-stranded DNA-binding protein [Cyclobacteriaceae bacterium]